MGNSNSSNYQSKEAQIMDKIAPGGDSNSLDARIAAQRKSKRDGTLLSNKEQIC